MHRLKTCVLDSMAGRGYISLSFILQTKGVVSVKNRRWRIGTVLFALIFALMALGGCGGGSDNKNPAPGPQQPGPQPQGKALEKWNGTWKSFDSSMDAPEVDALCEKVAKAVSGYTQKGVKSVLERSYHTDFDGLKVEGDKITFMDSKGTALGTLAYVSRGVEKRKFGNFDLEWHLFEAPAASGAANSAMHEQNGFDPKKSCRYLTMFAVHRDSPESPEHWHMRYGSEGFKALMDSPATSMWWPTLCKPESVADLLKEMSKPEAVQEVIEMMQNFKPFTAWKGDWKSAVVFLDDPVMTPVYETVAKKALEKGKNYTSETVKDFFKKMLHSDFGAMKLEGDKVTFLDDKGVVKATLNYVSDGLELRKFGEYPLAWSVFKVEVASPYKTLVLLPTGKDTADGFTHFHMRYGDKTPEALLDDPSLALWWPTLCEPGTTASKFAADMLAGADEMVEMLP